MMSALRFVLGLVAAVAAWALAVRLDPRLAPVFDPLLVLVAYHAVRSRAGRPASPLACAFVGSAAGLLHDVLTGGWLGLYGFSNALVGWTVSKVQQRMVVQQTVQIGLVGLLASAFQLAVLASLQFFMVPGGELPTVAASAVRMALTGVLLAVVHVVGRKVRAAALRWREQRRLRLGLDT